ALSTSGLSSCILNNHPQSTAARFVQHFLLRYPEISSGNRYSNCGVGRVCWSISFIHQSDQHWICLSSTGGAGPAKAGRPNPAMIANEATTQRRAKLISCPDDTAAPETLSRHLAHLHHLCRLNPQT
ncbi:MAG: hypothetical protein ACYC67_15650, partial [Prosthecobacter sp.]